MSKIEGKLKKRHADRIEPLRLVEASRLKRPAMEAAVIKSTSPWDYYTRIYSLELGENEPVIVAEEKGGQSYDVVSVHRCQSLSPNQLELLRSIQHPHFVTVREVYHEKDEWYIVTEHMTRSLQEAAGNPFLDSSRLAAITGQIVSALDYLENRGLRVSSLTCSDVLMHPSGRVKLIGQHNCVKSNSKEDIRRLGRIMMELMDGYVKEGGSIGLDDPERWSVDAVDFLSATTSALTASELLQHPFLHSWTEKRLRGLVSFVTTWTKQSYRYLGWQDGHGKRQVEDRVSVL